MIGDVWTVMWKEWRQLLLGSGGWRGGWLGMLFTVGVFGVFLPLQTGRGWVESPAPMALWLWVPLLLVSSVVADSFAGERERHTLETLLASRLSDRAILFGKVGAAIGYGWGLTMAMLMLGLVTVNLVHWQGELLLFSPQMAAGAAVIPLLAAGLVAGAGVLISLRAATVRQAAQVQGIMIVVLVFVPMLGLQALPVEWQLRLLQVGGEAGIAGILLGAAAALLVLDVLLLVAAMIRFQRAKLILD